MVLDIITLNKRRGEMGMFDRLFIRCKACGEKIEFQSKAGKCMLEEYNICDVPANIAGDLDGEAQTCLNCGKENTIVTRTFVDIYIK